MTRTAPEKTGARRCARDARGLLLPMPDPLARFAAQCRHEATTGCVMWIGGTTAGRGNSARYGAFWYKGRRWSAHRWAARFIHGLDIDGATVGHSCNRTLCVQHLEPQTLAANVAERNTRVAQTGRERQYWLLVELGYEPPPAAAVVDPDAVPFHEPPLWLQCAAPATNRKDPPF